MVLRGIDLGMMQKKLTKKFAFVFFPLLLVFVGYNQNCIEMNSPVQFAESLRFNGGTGDGYDGKPREGDWIRTLPNYSCPSGIEMAQAAIRMSRTTGEIVSDNCIPTGIVISKFDPSLEFRFYNPNYFTFAGATFRFFDPEKSQTITEAICRMDSSSRGIDTMITINSDGSLSAQNLMGDYATRDVRQQNYDRLVRTRDLTSETFESLDHTLKLTIQKNASEYRDLVGQLESNIDGGTKKYAVNCQKMSPLPVLSSVPGKQITYIIDRASGSDANNGTSESEAFFSVARCASVVNPGDSCVVKNGIYEESLYFTTSGTAASRVTFRNFQGHRPILSFIDTTVNGRFSLMGKDLRTLPISYVTVEGFEVTNAKAGGIKFNFGSELIFRNNYIHDNSGSGISGSGYRVRIEGNRFSRNGLARVPGASAIGRGVTISGQQNLVINNIIEQAGEAGISAGAYPFDAAVFSDPVFFDLRDNMFANNTFAYNQIEGITIWAQSGGVVSNNQVVNNIFFENCQTCKAGGQGIAYWSPNGSGDVIRNNLFYALVGAIIPISTGGNFPANQYTQSNNMFNTRDPLFVNPGSSDFHLRPTSPAIDSGFDLGAIVPTDITGKSRPNGLGHDIGSYEF